MSEELETGSHLVFLWFISTKATCSMLATGIESTSHSWPVGGISSIRSITKPNYWVPNLKDQKDLLEVSNTSLPDSTHGDHAEDKAGPRRNRQWHQPGDNESFRAVLAHVQYHLSILSHGSPHSPPSADNKIWLACGGGSQARRHSDPL